MKKPDRPQKNLFYSFRQFCTEWRKNWVFTGKYLDLQSKNPYIRVTGEEVMEAISADKIPKEQKKFKKPTETKDRKSVFQSFREFWASYKTIYHYKTPITEKQLFADWLKCIFSGSLIERMGNQTIYWTDLAEYERQQSEAADPERQAKKRRSLWYKLEPLAGFILVLFLILVLLVVFIAFVCAMIAKVQ